ncbi:MAG: cytochrome c oxidase subunit 3 [Planctomycetaceae bacterium]|nr:cytochrome c oxidase subunit 3 [Planctomycetaceae bacterium]
MPSEWDLVRADLSRRFFLAMLGQAGLVICLYLLLRTLMPSPDPARTFHLQPTYAVATALLVAGSVFLHRALASVRRERQLQFRQSLLKALGCAVLFVSIQSYALWLTIRLAPDGVIQPDVRVIIAVVIAIHAGHFIVAQSILLWVTLSAFRDRYDHEYHWGVTFATWCWHVLGLAWMFILLIAIMGTFSPRPPMWPADQGAPIRVEAARNL